MMNLLQNILKNLKIWRYKITKIQRLFFLCLLIQSKLNLNHCQKCAIYEKTLAWLSLTSILEVGLFEMCYLEQYFRGYKSFDREL